MPQVVDDLIFNVRGNLTTLDADLRTAENKLKQAKDRIEKSGILLKLKLDTTQVEKEVAQFVTRMQQKLNIKARVSLDMSDVNSQIGSLEARMSRLSGGGFSSFAGAALGGIVGGGRRGSSSGARTYITNDYRGAGSSQVNATQNALMLPQGFAVGGSGAIGRTVNFWSDFEKTMDNVTAALGYDDGPTEGSASDRYGTFPQNTNFVYARRSLTRNRRGAVINPFAGLSSPLNSIGGALGARRVGMARGIMGATGLSAGASYGLAGAGMMAGGVASGLGVAYAASQYLGGVGQSGAQSILSANSIRNGTNFSADDHYNAGLNSGSGFEKYYGNLPVINGIGRGLSNWQNAETLAGASVNTQKANGMRSALFQMQSNRGAMGINNAIGGAAQIQAQGDAEGIALSQARSDAERDARDGVGGKTAAQVAQSFDALQASQTARVQRQVASYNRIQSASTASSVKISGLTGIDDRAASRESIRSGFTARLYGDDTADASRAQSEMNAALGAEDRTYSEGTRQMAAGARINALGSGGYRKAAALASNAENERAALVGVTDQSRIDSIKSDRQSADQQVMKDFNNALADLASSAKSAAMSLGGNNLGAALEGINRSEAKALENEKDPAMQAAIRAGANVERQGARMGDAMDRVGINMGTAGLNRGAASQRMRNRGEYISANVNDIIGGTNDAIAQANIDLRGSEKTKDREARIAAIKNEANSRLEGISEMTRYTGRLGITSSQNFFGDSNNRAFADLANAQSAIAGANAGFNATGAATDVTKNSQGGTEQQQNQKMIDLLQKIADKYGTTAG